MIDELELALTYPYQRPTTSFLLHDRKIITDGAEFDTHNRIPVIACGSNAAPSQLLRKFTHTATRIYVSAAKLSDFACVYSPHITAYGSIPATLAYIPGHDTSCHITWLTEDQLQEMHQTEALGFNYRFSKLSKIKLHCDITGSHNFAFAYISLHGGLLIGDSLIEIAELSSSDQSQSIPKLDQTAVQKAVIKTLREDISLEEFVMGNINNNTLRQKRTQSLKTTSCAFSYPNEETVLDQL